MPNLPQPEPGLTAETLIARAAALRPLLREQQEESDARGRYSDAVHEQLLRGGFYRILQPRMFGGYELSLETYVRVVMELSRGHPAAGWCFTLAASISKYAETTGMTTKSAPIATIEIRTGSTVDAKRVKLAVI